MRLPGRGNPRGRLAAANHLRDRTRRRMQSGIAHRAREMERIRWRRDQQIRPVELDHLHAALGLHAAGNHRDTHQVERVMGRPEKHVRIVVGAGQRGVAGADAHRIERAGAGARPDFAIERRIAKRARRGGGARGRENHPALLRPGAIVDRRVATPWRIFRHIVGHLVFGGDGKLARGRRPIGCHRAAASRRGISHDRRDCARRDRGASRAVFQSGCRATSCARPSRTAAPNTSSRRVPR